MAAIETFARELVRANVRSTSIRICTDSQASLKPLVNPITTSGIIKEAKHFLDEETSAEQRNIYYLDSWSYEIKRQ